MLTGISPIFNPILLATLYKMSHGDIIVPADAHCYSNVIKANGIKIPKAILPSLELGQTNHNPFIMMSAAEGDKLNPNVAASYKNSISKTNPNQQKIINIEHLDFYKNIAKTYALAVNGKTAKYGNILQKKGDTLIIN